MKQLLTLVILIALIPSIRSQSCAPTSGYIEFATQTDIDNFPTDYPGCTTIEADIVIKTFYPWSPITSLDSLSQLEHITGYLYIVESDLTDLTGLNNLQSVGGYLWFYNNDSLQSLDGLDNIDSVGSILRIHNNPILTSIQGLQTLHKVREISIRDNPALPDLQGLGNIDSLEGFLEIENCDSLTDLAGLDNMVYLGTNFYVNYCDNMVNFNGIENLNHIGGRLYVRDNAMLTSMDGLDNVSYLGHYINIINNPELISLDALSNIPGASQFVAINNNDKLETLDGIDNIDLSGVSNLYIQDNDTLSFCATPNICEYMEIGLGNAHVSNNAGGCNTPQEVEMACEPLPLIWLKDLEASVVDGTVRLTWKAEAEITSGCFHIEHADGDMLFKPIGMSRQSVPGQPYKYTFDHLNPSQGRNYYRIWYQESDGFPEYSNITSVVLQLHAIDIYPNPATDMITISGAEECEISIIDPTGRVVWNTTPTTDKVELQTTSFGPGLFFLVSDCDEVIKFTIQ